MTRSQGFLRYAVAFIACAVILQGCHWFEQYDSIQDITFHPELYEGKTITIKGHPSTAFGLGPGTNYDFVYDNYQNQLKVLPSCGNFINYLGTDTEYVATGTFNNGVLDCFAPVYLEGNEPPIVQAKKGAAK